MTVSLETAIARYETVRDEVRRLAPTHWREAADLSRSVPERLSTRAFWEHGRTKPCWINVKVGVGTRVAADLALSTDFDDPHRIAGDSWAMRMRSGGRSWKANANFDLVGPAVQSFVSGLARGGMASYRWRLYAIRQFAISMTGQNEALAMAQALVDEPESLPPEEVFGWSRRFAQSIGTGWGAITVNHMLTDLGLSVKTDLWLRRAAVRLGLTELPTDLPYEEIDRLAYRIDPALVPALIRLSRHIRPTAHPTARTSLREIDKVLMEWSRQGLARPFN
jgi:hypothetical protein